MKLAENEEISDVELETFRQEYLFKRAMNKALASLQYTEKCELDIRKKLTESWFDAEIVEHTVDKLKYYGYLDDYRYACGFISKYAGKKSRRDIIYQLSTKKIDPSVVEKAYEDMNLPEESELLKENILRRYMPEDLSEKRDQILAYYARKGYSFYLINRCIKDILLTNHCTFC